MSIVNSISVSFTYSIILVGLLEKRSLGEFIRLFLLCLSTYLLFLVLGIESFLNLPMAILSMLVIKKKQDGYLLALFKALSAMTAFTLFVTTVGSLFFALLPDVMERADYELFMSIASVVFGVSTYAILAKRDMLKKFQRFYKHRSIVIKCIIAEAAFLSLISFALPLVLSADSENFVFASYYLLFSASIVFAAYLTYLLLTAETKIKYEEQRQKFEKVNSLVIEEKYNDIISLKHYYSKLYETLNAYITVQDWQGLEGYFEKHISPLHKEHIKSDFVLPKLDLIELPLIKNLLFDATVKARHVYSIEMCIDIEGCISDCFIQEMDLFIILNEWITNAFNATDCTDGYIHISISCLDADGILAIKVVNPIAEDIDIKAIYDFGYTTKQNHSGVGLNAVRKIALSYENVESMTYVELGKFTQFMIIRDS